MFHVSRESKPGKQLRLKKPVRAGLNELSHLLQQAVRCAACRYSNPCRLLRPLSSRQGWPPAGLRRASPRDGDCGAAASFHASIKTGVCVDSHGRGVLT
jgi:hypothetical protein